MSLPKYFKLHALNNTGAQIQFNADAGNNTLTVTGIGFKFTSAGALSFGSQQTLFADPSADLNDGAATEGGEIDNSSNLYLGYHCLASLETDNNSAGTVDIFVEYSTGGSAGGTYPSDSNDFDVDKDLIWVGQIVAAATSDEHRAANFTLGATPH